MLRLALFKSPLLVVTTFTCSVIPSYVLQQHKFWKSIFYLGSQANNEFLRVPCRSVAPRSQGMPVGGQRRDSQPGPTLPPRQGARQLWLLGHQPQPWAPSTSLGTGQGQEGPCKSINKSVKSQSAGTRPGRDTDQARNKGHG